MARLVWQPRQRSLPHRVAPGTCLDHALPHSVPAPTSAYSAAARRTIWHRDRAGRPGWFRLRDPRQRVHGARPPARPGASAPAARSVPAPDSKVRLCAVSTTAQKCQWGLRACSVAWWWPPIQPAKRRARLASRVRALSTSCSSPRCHEPRFTASDVVELYLHRGAFEPQLSDEDAEQDPHRWCSPPAWAQQCSQPVSHSSCTPPPGRWPPPVWAAWKRWALVWKRLCPAARWEAAWPGFPKADPA